MQAFGIPFYLITYKREGLAIKGKTMSLCFYESPSSSLLLIHHFSTTNLPVHDYPAFPEVPYKTVLAPFQIQYHECILPFIFGRL
jgi:hypothetical protein